ncbi:MAG: NAD(P)H-hydrate dehydratase [Clostridia bacterium]|nr:NAD(P)H-hydrate dehydratase [Clostridia bacterium]
MKIALTTKDMAYCDKRAIESGIPSAELMLRVASKVFSSCKWRGKIYIICGKGNNGGDGLALANVMLDNKLTPYVYLIEEPSTDDGRFYLSELKKKGFSNIYSIDGCDYDCDIMVDCIFGTGFKGAPKEKYAQIIELINSSRAFKISVDIPSGLDGDSGKYEVCVKADETISVQYAKTGLYLNDGKDMIGKLSLIDVGIGLYVDGYKIVEDDDVSLLFPKRRNNTHKGSYGKSVIIGGCTNYLGAVKLANAGLCALRSGGGLNTLIVPKTHIDNIAKSVWESTVIGMRDQDGYMLFDKEELDRALVGVDSVAIGMGIGNRYEENLKIISHILKNYDVRVIIDADGLNSLALDVDVLKEAKAEVIVTPHIKEMSRLCSKSVEEIASDPIGVAKNFAKEYGVNVLLKGASSVITDGSSVYIVVNGGAELSKGGSGDTLSGVMLGMLSQGRDVLASAYSAAYLTAKTAKCLCEEYSEYGVLPSDVSKEIARIIKETNKTI